METWVTSFLWGEISAYNNRIIHPLTHSQEILPTSTKKTTKKRGCSVGASEIVKPKRSNIPWSFVCFRCGDKMDEQHCYCCWPFYSYFRVWPKGSYLHPWKWLGLRLRRPTPWNSKIISNPHCQLLQIYRTAWLPLVLRNLLDPHDKFYPYTPDYSWKKRDVYHIRYPCQQ